MKNTENNHKQGFWQGVYVRFLMKMAYKQEKYARRLRLPMGIVLTCTFLFFTNAILIAHHFPLGTFWALVMSITMILMLLFGFVCYVMIVGAKLANKRDEKLKMKNEK